MGVVGHGLHFGVLIGGQILLSLNHQGHRGHAVLKPALLVFQTLFRQHPRIDGGLVTGACLLQPDDAGLDVHANLIDGPLEL